MFQKHKFTFAYIIVAAAIVLPWFLHLGYIFLVDFVWGPSVVVDWTQNQFLLQIIIRSLGYIIPIAFLQKLFLAGVLFILVWAGCKLARQFIEDQWLSFALSLFALFNPFVYDRLLYGQVGVVLSFGLATTAVALLIEFYKNQKVKPLVLAALFSALAIMFTPHFAFFLAAFYALFIILIFIRHRRFNVRKTLLYLSVAPLVIFVLNANWIYAGLAGYSQAGVLVKQGIQRQDLVAFRTSGKTGGEALRNVIFMSGFWGEDQFRYIGLNKIQNGLAVSFLFLMPLIILGAYIGIRRRETRALSIGLLLLYCAAVLLAVGIRLPVARDITYWLFDHAPFYKGLRETQKWVSVEIIVYLIFLGIGIRAFFRAKFIRGNSLIFKILLSAVIVMQAPLLMWGFRGQAKPVQYPSDWNQADQLVTHDSNCASNILVLPWHLYINLSFAKAVVANPASQFFTCKTFQGTNMEFGGIYSNDPNPQSKIIQEWIVKQGKTDLLTADKLNIRYIVLYKETDWKNYAWLNGLPHLKLLQDSPTIKVYKLQ